MWVEFISVNYSFMSKFNVKINVTQTLLVLNVESIKLNEIKIVELDIGSTEEEIVA